LSVYDLGEVVGPLFLSMDLTKGEELSSLMPGKLLKD
jgi:hypothetical protein